MVRKIEGEVMAQHQNMDLEELGKRFAGLVQRYIKPGQDLVMSLQTVSDYRKHQCQEENAELCLGNWDQLRDMDHLFVLAQTDTEADLGQVSVRLVKERHQHPVDVETSMPLEFKWGFKSDG